MRLLRARGARCSRSGRRREAPVRRPELDPRGGGGRRWPRRRWRRPSSSRLRRPRPGSRTVPRRWPGRSRWSRFRFGGAARPGGPPAGRKPRGRAFGQAHVDVDGARPSSVGEHAREREPLRVRSRGVAEVHEQAVAHRHRQALRPAVDARTARSSALGAAPRTLSAAQREPSRLRRAARRGRGGAGARLGGADERQACSTGSAGPSTTPSAATAVRAPSTTSAATGAARSPRCAVRAGKLGCARTARTTANGATAARSAAG